MTGRKRAMATDLAKVDAHKIMPEEYEEIPELTDDWFAQAAPSIGGRPVSDDAWRLAARKIGRPKSPNPKGHVNLRLDADVLAHFRRPVPVGKAASMRSCARRRDCRRTRNGCRDCNVRHICYKCQTRVNRNSIMRTPPTAASPRTAVPPR